MVEIIKTGDGSHTLFVAENNQHYHSTFGAIQESMHVFINAGLKLFESQTQLNILEVGFGTGLNALLTLIHSQNKNISYHGLEAFPLGHQIISELNYPHVLDHENCSEYFQHIHEVAWEEAVWITKNFSLAKYHTKVEECHLEDGRYDLIYFDAFAPDVQPELWTEEVFVSIFKSMKVGGILVTYSSKGLVKQNLRNAGFTVKRLKGPPGKHHMLRAEKGMVEIKKH